MQNFGFAYDHWHRTPVHPGRIWGTAQTTAKIILPRAIFFVRIYREGVYLKSVSRTGISLLSVARDKAGIVDSTPYGTELPQAHLSFLALILACSAPVISGKFL